MDKDQIKQDELQEPEVTELDDNSLEDASGGATSTEKLQSSNGNCLC
jgi:hypothetical protein